MAEDIKCETNKVSIDNVILSVAVLAQALTAFGSMFGWWRWHKMLVRIGLGSWEQKIRVRSILRHFRVCRYSEKSTASKFAG